MPKPWQRNRSKARKKKRTIKHLVTHYVERKKAKHSCSVCGKIMHGLPHRKLNSEVARLSKTEKRPTALLAGTLCNNCRTIVLEEAVKV